MARRWEMSPVSLKMFMLVSHSLQTHTRTQGRLCSSLIEYTELSGELQHGRQFALENQILQNPS